MDQPSQNIADRYQLALSDRWRSWFDREAVEVPFAGEFRHSGDHELLLDRAPSLIWSGLMLPDTLPLIGNDYGDWICVRVTADNRIGELLHWYHGGGDWIPVGTTIGEAVLHDVMDQFRPRARHVLRGAAESTSPSHMSEVVARLKNAQFIDWLKDSLCADAAQVEALQRWIAALEQLDYATALNAAQQAGWATEAIACDQAEYALQFPIRAIAAESFSRQLGMNYDPDFIRWLFDLQQVPAEALHQIQEVLHTTGQPPVTPELQDWQRADDVASMVLQRRSDLAWAVDVAGWSSYRRGDPQTACSIYFHGRYASAFSNQSIRLRSHGFDSQFGKFAVAELWRLRDHLTTAERDDAYIQTIWQTPQRQVQTEVQRYWMNAGKSAMHEGKFAAAYDCFYRAGWDLGAQRMTDYSEILHRLVESAEAAGWKARAAVAATHLACLAKLTPPSR